jgi:hypothetical protein
MMEMALQELLALQLMVLLAKPLERMMMPLLAKLMVLRLAKLVRGLLVGIFQRTTWHMQSNWLQSRVRCIQPLNHLGI